MAVQAWRDLIAVVRDRQEKSCRVQENRGQENEGGGERRVKDGTKNTDAIETKMSSRASKEARYA